MEPSAHYLWAALVTLGAWSFRSLVLRVTKNEERLREVELSERKTATENKALFKRLDELRDGIHELGSKLDRFMGR